MYQKLILTDAKITHQITMNSIARRLIMRTIPTSTSNRSSPYW